MSPHGFARKACPFVPSPSPPQRRGPQPGRPPGRGQRTRGLSRRSGRSPSLDRDVLKASPELRDRCRRPGPAIQPPPPGAPLTGALPLSLAEPGRDTAGSSLLEPRRGEGMRLSEPPVLSREGAGQRQMHQFISAFGLGSCPPIPLPGLESFGFGPEGSVKRDDRSYPRDGAGVRVAGVGAAQGSSTFPQSLGGPPPLEPQSTRTAGAGGMPATRLPASGSVRVRAKERGGGGEGLSPRPSGSSGGCR